MIDDVTEANESPKVAQTHVPRSLFDALFHRVSFWISGTYLALLIVGCIAAPIVAPYGPQASNFSSILQGPSGSHFLGTDELGRDVLSRLLFGGQVTLLGAAEAVLTFVILGLPLGLLAGYLGPRADRLVMSAMDVVLSLPVIILLLVVGALFAGNLALMITLGVIASPGIVRVVRAATQAVRAELYVKAAEVAGLSKIQILRRHIIPRIIGPALVQVTVFAAAAVVIESTLGFLGLDASPPAPSWGSMVADGASQINQQPWLIIPTGLTIAITVLGIGVLGDVLRDSTTRETPKVARKPMWKRNRSLPLLETALNFDESIENVDDRRPALLSVRNLMISLRRADGDQSMVEGVSFDVREGEALGIVGESGSGKTLTVLALLDLLPDNLEATNGSIVYAGEELVGGDRRKRARLRGREISYISQDPMLALDPGFTVGSQLREVLRHSRGLSRRDARTHAVELLDQVELPNPAEVLRRFPHELSGGMAQRVCIAMALSGNPKLLIADEPTTALDVTIQAEILDLLRTLRETTGLAVILVSHDWGVIADSCDDTVVMYAGQVVEYASILDLFSLPLHPYTKGLLAANPHLASDGPFPSIPGNVPSPDEWPDGCRFQSRCAYVKDDCRTGHIPLERLEIRRLSRCIHTDLLASEMV
jgi:peptide/nickel transport system permease protein